MIMVRQATVQDLERIAVVHQKCFPESFSSSIGIKLLKKFYLEYMNDAPELFLVSENSDHEIVGFCMGYYMERDYNTSRFIKNNFIEMGLTCALRLLSGDKRVWKRIFHLRKHAGSLIVNHSFDDVPAESRGDLLSICVLPAYRGGGFAQEMLLEYLNILRNHHRSLCLLSVEVDNGRGIRFYEKNGFVLYRKTDDGSGCYRYIKDLEG